MAAAKKKGWLSGRRSVATQPVQMTRHLIVCEGTQTDPLYFEGMKAALGAANGRKLSVVVRGTGRHTLDLLDCAQELCRYAADTYDHVWPTSAACSTGEAAMSNKPPKHSELKRRESAARRMQGGWGRPRPDGSICGFRVAGCSVLSLLFVSIATTSLGELVRVSELIEEGF